MIEKEGPIHVSNVALVDPKDEQADPRRASSREDGKRVARRQAVRHRDRLELARCPRRTPEGRATSRRSAPQLIERFGYSSVMQAPRIEKITLNMGVGEAKQDSKMLEAATEQLATIAGQKPNVRRARKSIAAFKLREGMPVGVAVTLRGERAYEFLDRLMSVAIPRIRDFRGLNPRSFDGRGNYSMGVREQIIFPEIDYDAIDQVRGLDITITTTAPDRRGGLRAPRGVRHALRTRGRPTATPQLTRRSTWPRPHSGCARRAPPSTRPASTLAAVAAAAPARCTASSACAGSACASWPTTATSPA